ncbi:MAG: hypothetical protein CMO80_03500 [Verrucomicrobiales bacterium]|nr:hypothetical protein [Verrucomicrobiales bacterium]|tara:strand:+ start:1849 stop:2088 length:240 start_codon:yes stop_codon:yes gene_type:complete
MKLRLVFLVAILFSDASQVFAQIANTLQSIGLRVGAIAQFTRRTAMSFQLDPGIYSDIHDGGIDDFSAPFIQASLHTEF